tara:strand:+ start:62 stop:355 length:294 start_codon:yes stop_codon:yes gene_type:complete
MMSKEENKMLTIIGVLVLVFVVSLTFTGCKSGATIQKEPDEYVRERHMWETTDIICDSAVYRYTFIGCMESSKAGWDQDESACKAYAKSQACKQKQR